MPTANINALFYLLTFVTLRPFALSRAAHCSSWAYYGTVRYRVRFIIACGEHTGQEIKTGPAGSVAFLAKDGNTDLVFSSNAEAGSLVVIDGKTDEIVETIAVTEGATHARIWMLGNRA